MTKIAEILATVADLHDEEAIKKAELEQVQGQVQQETDRLRAELAAGGTTNDPVLDLVLKIGCRDDDPALPKYRELQKRLKGKRGDFVMIRYHIIVRQHGGKSSESGYRHETRFRVGLLAGEELRLGTSTVILLPIDRYRQGHWPPSHVYDISFENEHPSVPPQKDFFEWHRYDVPPNLLQYLLEEHLAPDLIVGDEAFRAELKKVGREKFFNIVAEVLGRLIREPTGEQPSQSGKKR